MDYGLWVIDHGLWIVNYCAEHGMAAAGTWWCCSNGTKVYGCDSQSGYWAAVVIVLMVMLRREFQAKILSALLV